MFCEKCGNELSSGTVFCSKCGNKVGAADSQQSPPQPQPVYQQPVYQQPPPPTYQQQPAYQPPVKVAVPHYAPGGYAERLHSFGGSVLFMVGIILFTAGKLFTTFASFSVWSFFSLMILALPVTGFWLIFAASKMPRLPEKTLTSLTLFKVSIIIDLVVSCIIGLLFVIVSIVLFAGASLDGAFVAVGIFMFLIAGVVVTVAVLYFKACINMLGGIRHGLTYNVFAPLPGIKIFTILTYISVGLSALGTLFSLAASAIFNTLMYSVMRQIPSFMRDFIDFGGGGGTAAFSTLFTLTGIAGVVVCVISLNQFNNSMLTQAPTQNNP